MAKRKYPNLENLQNSIERNNNYKQNAKEIFETLDWEFNVPWVVATDEMVRKAGEMYKEMRQVDVDNNWLLLSPNCIYNVIMSGLIIVDVKKSEIQDLLEFIPVYAEEIIWKDKESLIEEYWEDAYQQLEWFQKYIKLLELNGESLDFIPKDRRVIKKILMPFEISDKDFLDFIQWNDVDLSHYFEQINKIWYIEQYNDINQEQSRIAERQEKIKQEIQTLNTNFELSVDQLKSKYKANIEDSQKILRGELRRQYPIYDNYYKEIEDSENKVIELDREKMYYNWINNASSFAKIESLNEEISKLKNKINDLQKEISKFEESEIHSTQNPEMRDKKDSKICEICDRIVEIENQLEAEIDKEKEKLQSKLQPLQDELLQLQKSYKSNKQQLEQYKKQEKEWIEDNYPYLKDYYK